MSLQRTIQDKRLTITAIAAQLQVNKGTVSRWVTGRSMVPSRYLRPLARVVGVTIDDLIPPEVPAAPTGTPQ